MTTETFERPGLLGRSVRIAAGVVMLGWCLKTLSVSSHLMSDTVPRHPLLWMGIVTSFALLPSVVNKGFLHNWGRVLHLIVVLLAAVAMVYNLIRFGSWWGLPLGILLFVLVVYVTGHLGLSFLLAGIIARPG